MIVKLSLPKGLIFSTRVAVIAKITACGMLRKKMLIIKLLTKKAIEPLKVLPNNNVFDLNLEPKKFAKVSLTAIIKIERIKNAFFSGKNNQAAAMTAIG